MRDDVLTGLGLADPVERHLTELTATLDTGWRLLAQRLAEAGSEASVRIEPAGTDGRVRLAMDRLEAIGEPPSLVELRDTVTAMLPRVDLPELLLASSRCWPAAARGARGPHPAMCVVRSLLSASSSTVGLNHAPRAVEGSVGLEGFVRAEDSGTRCR